MTRRLYLDTGDLLAIADARVAQHVVDALRAAMSDSATRLVLSRAHIQDSVSNADAGTKERFITAVESFQPVLVILEGPESVEPLTPERRDILLQPCTNFRELVMSVAADRWLADANETQDGLHAGELDAKELLDEIELPRNPLRKDCVELAFQCVITLTRGWLGHSAEPVLDFWLRETGLTLSERERTTVLAQLEAVAARMRALSPTIERQGIDTTQTLREIAQAHEDPTSAPGRRLVLLVASMRSADSKRTRLRSDWVDLDHVAHLPYVDIASCDRGTFHAVNQLLPRIQGPRTPRIFRNGQLARITEALRMPPV